MRSILSVSGVHYEDLVSVYIAKRVCRSGHMNSLPAPPPPLLWRVGLRRVGSAHGLHPFSPDALERSSWSPSPPPSKGSQGQAWIWVLHWAEQSLVSLLCGAVGC